MKTVWIMMLLPLLATAQVDYDRLQTKIDSDASRDSVLTLISEEGTTFAVDLSLLKRMKNDGFPDWLIDYLVARDTYATNEGDTDPQGFYGSYGLNHGYYWNSYWDYAWSMPFYATFWNPYYWGTIYPQYGGVHATQGLPGNILRRSGYRNEVPERSRGTAVPRGNRPSTGKPSAPNRSSSTRSSSRSSSGGKVTTRGYHRK